jgi:hypothetical protein
MIFGRSNTSYQVEDVRSPRSRYLTKTDQNGFGGFDEIDADDSAYDAIYDSARPVDRRDRIRSTESIRTYPSAQNWSRPSSDPDYGDVGYHELDDDDDDDSRSFKERVEAAHVKMAERASQAQSSVSENAKGAADSVSSGASRVASGIASGASDAASAVSAGASSAASALSRAYSGIAEGTENLSEAARVRVIAARERAIIGRQKAKRAVQSGAASAGDFFEDQPLVAGALALAVGAALGGALPRTRYEDENIGQQSDAMFREAERIYRHEMTRAKSVANAVAEEAKDIVKDVRTEADKRTPGDKSAEHSLADAARNAGSRLENAAKDEAAKHGDVSASNAPSAPSQGVTSVSPNKSDT